MIKKYDEDTTCKEYIKKLNACLGYIIIIIELKKIMNEKITKMLLCNLLFYNSLYMNKINFEHIFSSLRNLSGQISNKTFNNISVSEKINEENKMEQISHLHKLNLIVKQLTKLEQTINHPKKKK